MGRESWLWQILLAKVKESYDRAGVDGRQIRDITTGDGLFDLLVANDLVLPPGVSLNDLAAACWLNTDELQWQQLRDAESVLMQLSIQAEEPTGFTLTELVTEIDVSVEHELNDPELSPETIPGGSLSSDRDAWIPFEPCPSKALGTENFRGALMSKGGGKGRTARWHWKRKADVNVESVPNGLFCGLVVAHHGHPFLIQHRLEGRMLENQEAPGLSFSYRKPFKFSTDRNREASLTWRLSPQTGNTPSMTERELRDLLEQEVRLKYSVSDHQSITTTRSTPHDQAGHHYGPPPLISQGHQFGLTMINDSSVIIGDGGHFTLPPRAVPSE